MKTQFTTTTDNQGMTPVSPADAAQCHLGFKRVEAKVHAVPQERLQSINLDVPSTVATALGAYPEMLEQRPLLVGLNTFDIQKLDDLQDFTLALGHTHVEYRNAGGLSDGVSELGAECLETRDRFHADATALAKRKLLDEARVAKLRGGNSYRMISFDILGLAALFIEQWDAIQNKTALEMTELEAARLKANQLVTAVGRREQATPAVNQIALVRQQAYTLFVEAYSDTRDAIAFVRRAQGDVDRIAPSLFAGRGRRPEAAEVAPPVTSPGTHAEPAPAIGTVPVGFPGSSPLMAK